MLKAVINPVHLELDASQEEGHSPRDDSRSTGCICRICTAKVSAKTALSGVTCRVPLPEEAPEPDEAPQDPSLPQGLQSQVWTIHRLHAYTTSCCISIPPFCITMAYFICDRCTSMQLSIETELL